MNISDRFHKKNSFSKFPLESLSKKIFQKNSITDIVPSDHLLHFILNKSKNKFSIQTKLLTKRPSIFESSPRMRSIKKKVICPKVSKILVDKDERTINLSGVLNDFYSHMVDSISKDIIAFGIFDQLILFNLEENCFFRPLKNHREDILESLTSITANIVNSEILAVGSSNGKTKLIDLNKQLIIKNMNLHCLRVGSIKFHPTKSFLLASGSKDCSVIIKDLRIKQNIRPEIIFEHEGEICGLSWQTSGFCLASGGNDNLIKIFDLRKKSEPILKIKEHSAAVRALEFSPMNDDLLASGGGTGDSSIRISSIKNHGKNSVVLKTQSQICSLLWDNQCNRLLTSHGFSKYQLCLWNLEREKLLEEYYGHSNRILDIIRIKQSNLVLSFSSDNTAKIWNPFKAPIKSRNNLFTPIKLR